MSVHGRFPKGQKVMVIYHDGSRVVGKFIRYKSGRIFLDPQGWIDKSTARAITVYRPDRDTESETNQKPVAEKPMVVELVDVSTTDKYWDCECDEDYIHAKSDTLMCVKCGAVAWESSDSMKSEVRRLFPNLKEDQL